MAPALAAAGISTLTGAAQGIYQIINSAQQKKRAEDLRSEANKVQAPQIAKQYLEADRIREWEANQGMPGISVYKKNLESNTSDAVRQVEQASSSGANTVAAIASIYGNQNRSTNDLNAKDAAYRDKNIDAAAQSKQMLGEVEDRNQMIKRQEQSQIRLAASQLENASTANKTAGVSGILGSLGKGAAGALGASAATPSEDGTSSAATTTSQPSTGQGATSDLYMKEPNVAQGYTQAATDLGLQPSAQHPAEASPEEITSIQRHLSEKGLYSGPIDGKYSDDMKAVLESYGGTPYNNNLNYVGAVYNSPY